MPVEGPAKHSAASAALRGAIQTELPDSLSASSRSRSSAARLEPPARSYHGPRIDLARAAVDGDLVALAKRLGADCKGSPRKVDFDRLAADDARFVERPRYDCGMAERAARRRHDAVSAEHPADVLGAGGWPHENDVLALGRRFGRAVRIEHRGPVRVTRRRTQPLGEHPRLGQRALVEGRPRELADLIGADPADAFTRVDHAFGDEIGGDAHRRGRRAFRRPNLQQIESSGLDGELDVDRVAIEPLEFDADLDQVPSEDSVSIPLGSERSIGLCVPATRSSPCLPIRYSP